MAGRAVTKVVKRCDAAKEDNNLDLSSCDLSSFPDAVFLLMKNNDLQTCTLSDNVLKRLPSKFGLKFTTLTELHLDSNKLTGLPDEMRGIAGLRLLDISFNQFDKVPSVVFEFKELQNFNAENNLITEVNTQNLKSLLSLVEVNFQLNPLTESVQAELLSLDMFTVLITPTDKHIDAVD